jgi:hypothetical protein
VVLAAALALVVVSGSVAAASPQPIAFTIDMHYEVGTGTYEVTSGSGLICATGTVEDTYLHFAGYQGGQGTQLVVKKTLACEAGTFFVKMQIDANPDGTESFSWVVQGGTGDYDRLRGSGSGSTVPGDPGHNTGYFSGFLIG